MEQSHKTSTLVIVLFVILMVTVISCTYLIIKNYGQGNIIIKTDSQTSEPQTTTANTVNQKTYQQVIEEREQRAAEIRQKLFPSN